MLQIELDDRCFKLLALRQPMAPTCASLCRRRALPAISNAWAISR